MNSKDIRFATQEYAFNVQCKGSSIELKLNTVYEYQIVADSLMVGNETGFTVVEVLRGKAEVFQELNKYAGKSLLRLDKATPETGVYVFNLLCFYQHTHFDEPYQIVLDAAIYPELRRRNLDSQSAVKFLTKELIFDGRYWFAYGNDRRNNEQRLYGKNITVGVCPAPQGYLHVLDIRDHKRRADNLITLMSGTIEIKDDTEALQRVTEDFMEKYKQATRDNAELINLWKIYDELNQEAIKEDAAEMGFLKYKSYRRSSGNLVFNVEGGYVLSEFLRSDMQYAVLAPENFNKEQPLEYNPKTAIVIGSEFDKRCVNTTEFIISEESVDSFRKLPERGYIVPSINGSVIQSKRRRAAQKRILNGENPMPGLNLLIQSGDIVGVLAKERPAITSHLHKYIFGSDTKKDFNDRQKEAIRIAINTPDIAVIQGPPGTGKTQVIKAIIERINELEDGKAKILVTSTQHDAVDNAIRQVSYSGVPVNRVFNRERAVNEDTPMFGWIDQMVNSCGAWLIQNKIQSTTQDIFACLASLMEVDKDALQARLNELYLLLQKDGYSAELLALVNNTIVNLIDVSEPAFDGDSDSLLVELIDRQRISKDEFLVDGSKQLSTLERHLKFDCEDVDFDIPSYWKLLRRANENTVDLEAMLSSFREDLTRLKKMCASSGPESSVAEDVASLITPVIEAVNHEIAARGDEMTDAQKLYNQVWLFKRELSNIQNVKQLISAYSKVNAATCQQSANKFLSPAMQGFDEIYDYVIIDEAARSNPLDLLIPMSMGKKVILVGDHKQLPHMVERDIVESVIAKTKDSNAGQVLEESLFMRLFTNIREADEKAKMDTSKPVHVTRTCTLNEQFRMHSQICELINVFYRDEQLKAACDDADKQHNLNLYNNKPLVWLDVPASEKYPFENKGISKFRPCEVEVTRQELSKILLANPKFEVGIITFYSRQAEELRKMVDDEFPGDIDRISVGTVDAFQGKEFDVVILSAVRSNTEEDMKKRVGFLNNNNRLCVAFSRAKRLLITIGDSKTVAHNGTNVIIEPLNELLVRSKREDIGYYEAL